MKRSRTSADIDDNRFTEYSGTNGYWAYYRSTLAEFEEETKHRSEKSELKRIHQATRSSIIELLEEQLKQISKKKRKAKIECIELSSDEDKNSIEHVNARNRHHQWLADWINRCQNPNTSSQPCNDTG
jgi:hypothetical protein